MWETASDRIRDNLPASPNHVQFVYLRKGSYSRLGWARPPQRNEDGQIIDPAMIAIHPNALSPAWRPVLLGLLNHEMLHLAIPEHGHDEVFHREERVLPEFQKSQEWRFKFIDHITSDARRIKGVYVYDCPSCHRVVESIRRMPEKSACRHCCLLFNDGDWSATYALNYVGRQHPIRTGEHDD